jgi:phosphatidate phosphatase APP1
MAQSGLSSTRGSGSGDGAAASGSRRKKVYGYLKAANELRQAYTSQWAGQRNEHDEDYYNTPGAFPDVEIARSGDEEMVLFPSYARKLAGPKKTDASPRPRRDSWSETIDEYRGAAAEAENDDKYVPAWDETETPDSVVAVDVRGWIYAPGRGPMSRKHRLMIALARKLSGIAAPTGSSNDEIVDKIPGKGDDEYVDKEMQSLVESAVEDADPAWKSSSVDRTQQPTAPLSKDELSMANAHLMERLRPFLTNPVASMPVTVFFFDENESKSRNITTDESGHFSLRAALPFVPTHIRVLASEDLSAARPIEIIDPVGISLISDIDDTVKHSAIASGAKEMFRNTFIRELDELTIEGVSDWYGKMAKQGVQIHYVSNAPWQLYPLLERYFKKVGLPPGSFHLKQYSGMLQGIFEPTAERKRGSLEQILRDFPERKFILVGDSGEADLEVYTEIVLANPGRILGIFIRDVTTVETKPFFDKSVSQFSPSKRSRSSPDVKDSSDAVMNRPVLPPRSGTSVEPSIRSPPMHSEPDPKDLELEDLIDLTDLIIDDKPPPSGLTHPTTARPPPVKPIKPSALRMVSTPADLAKASKPSSLRQVATPSDATETDSKPPAQEAPKRKPVPPVPPKRASAPKTEADPSPGISRSSTAPSGNDIPSSWLKGLDSGSTTTQNQTQAARAKPPPPRPPPRRTNTGSSIVSVDQSASTTPVPSTGGIQSYPAAAAQAAYQGFQYASDRLNFSGSQASGKRPSVSNESGVPPAPLPNKREELWRRRWERAADVLEQHGVVLGSWRVGSDAQPVCAWLIEEAVKDMKAGRK